MNSISWKYVSPLKDTAAINKIEKKYHYVLPEEFKSCVLQNNAGMPSRSILKRPENEYVFGGLMSFNKDDADNIYDFIELFEVDDGKELKLFPFGLDPFGNFYCFNNGKVVYYDHETDQSKIIAESFAEFLGNLSEN